MQRLPTVANKTLEAEYYQQRQAEQAAKKAIDKAKKPKRINGELVITDRVREIAADLRTHTRGYVAMKHNVSHVTVDKILGEMDLGNL